MKTIFVVFAVLMLVNYISAQDSAIVAAEATQADTNKENASKVDTAHTNSTSSSPAVAATENSTDKKVKRSVDYEPFEYTW